MKKIILILTVLFAVQGQAQKVADTIMVDGLCEMCKTRIETSLDVKGIWQAEWDMHSRKLFVVYKPSKISREEIGAILNEVGHDNEISKATDEQYNKIHGCCLYRDEEVIKAHEIKEEKHEHH